MFVDHQHERLLRIIALRTQALHEAHIILVNAEKGDLDCGILPIRDAGTLFCKDYPREAMIGAKNDVRRAKNLLKPKMKTEMEALSQAVQDNVIATVEAYQQLEKEIAGAGKNTENWTARNILDNVSGLMLIIGQLDSRKQDIAQCMKQVDNEREQLKKAKAANTRSERIEWRRKVQVFDDAKLPLNWRIDITEKNLILDPEDIDHADPDLPDCHDFDTYKPSQDSEGGEFNQDSWAAPKWWASDAEGGHQCNMMIEH